MTNLLEQLAGVLALAVAGIVRLAVRVAAWGIVLFMLFFAPMSIGMSILFGIAVMFAFAVTFDYG
jgi:hypothetical protein